MPFSRDSGKEAQALKIEKHIDFSENDDPDSNQVTQKKWVKRLRPFPRLRQEQKMVFKTPKNAQRPIHFADQVDISTLYFISFGMWKERLFLFRRVARDSLRYAYRQVPLASISLDRRSM